MHMSKSTSVREVSLCISRWHMSLAGMRLSRACFLFMCISQACYILGTCMPQGVHHRGVHLMGVRLMGVSLLRGMHLTGLHLIQAYIS